MRKLEYVVAAFLLAHAALSAYTLVSLGIWHGTNNLVISLQFYGPWAAIIVTKILLGVAILRDWGGWRTYGGMLGVLLVLSSVAQLSQVTSAAIANWPGPPTAQGLSLQLLFAALPGGIGSLLLVLANKKSDVANHRGLPDFLTHMFGFSGRIARIDYWLMRLFLLPFIGYASAIPFSVAMTASGGNPLSANRTPIFFALVCIFYAWGLAMLIATAARRWHDLDRSGWWQLINFVPFGGLYALALCGFVEGTPGRNTYGDDPLGRDAQVPKPDTPHLVQIAPTIPDDDPRLKTLVSSLTNLVSFGKDYISVSESGTGATFTIAQEFGELQKQYSGDKKLWLAYAEAMQTSMQGKTAADIRSALLAEHPDFWPATVAQRNMPPIFMLPPFDPVDTVVHHAINDKVTAALIVATRRGITARAVLFLRDANNELPSDILRSCRIDSATILNTATMPNVVGVYVRIHDHPTRPYQLEALSQPFVEGSRLPLELFSRQATFEFVVLNPAGRVKGCRTLTPSLTMVAVHRELGRLLDGNPKSEPFDARMTRLALQQHVSTVDFARIPF